MRLYHPELDRTIKVPDSTGRILRDSGWIDPPDVETDDQDPAHAGSSDSDTPVSEDSNEE